MPRGLMALLAAPKGGESKGAGASKAAPAADDPELMAAEDLIEAIKGGDAGSVKAAFKRMYDACAAGGDETELPEEEL